MMERPTSTTARRSHDAGPRSSTGPRPAGRLRAWAAAGIVGLAGLLSACGGGGGGGDDGGGDPPAGGGTEYFPMALGDRWISREGSVVGFITTRVTDVQTTGSTQNITLTQFTIDGVRTPLQLRREPGGIYLLPGDDDPVYLRNLGPLLQMKLPVRAGETYVQIAPTTVDLGEDLDGDNRNETAQIGSSITVLGLVSVTLPDIGTLGNVAQLRTTLTITVTLSSTGETQTIVTNADDYYAPDIGPVKSVISIDGLGQIYNEETVGYAVGNRRSETRRPVATQQTPAPGTTIWPDRLIEIFFDEELDAYGLEIAPPVIRRADGLAAPGRFVLTDGQRLTFVPEGNLPSGVYTVDFAGGVSDVYGNPPDLPTWTFTVDGDAPVLLSSSLANGATGVPLDVEILLTFSEPVVPEGSVFAYGPAGFGAIYSMTAQVASEDGRTIRLVPNAPLTYSTTYQLSVSALVRDTVGNYLGTPAVINFSTVAGRFAAAAALPIASPVTDSMVADLTGDGRRDLLVATLFGNAPDTDYRVLLLPSQADGSLGTPRELPAGASSSCRPFTLAAADLNADGRSDVLVWRENCGLRLMLQAADGSYSVAWDDTSVAMDLLVDVDGDGRLDAVARDSGRVRIHPGQADGRFGTAIDVATPSFTAFAVGDVSGDGRADIVGVGASVAVLRQLAGGGFAAPEELVLTPGDTANGVAIGDINGDGRADLVYSLQTSTSNDALAWRLQQADGSLGFVETARSPARPSVLELADLDGDARLDVVLGHDSIGVLSVFIQGSNGTLGSYETFVLPSQGFLQQGSLTVGDFSADGRPDILVGGSLLRQTAPASGGSRRSPLAVRAGSAATRTSPDVTSALPAAGHHPSALKATIQALRQRLQPTPPAR